MNDIFYRLALGIYKWICIRKYILPTNARVEKDLKLLHPGENHKQVCMEYYVRKLSKSLMISLAAIALGIILWVQSGVNSVIKDGGEILRGNYGEDAVEVDVECVLGEQVQDFRLEVPSRIYGEEELLELYQSFSEELPTLILGRNASLNEVTDGLNLRDTYQGYPFGVEWESGRPDLVKSDGTVIQGEEATEVMLSATISYGEWEWEQGIKMCVAATVLSEEEAARKALEKLLAESEESSRTEERWKLPENWQGQSLEWAEKKTNRGWAVAIGGIFVSVLIFLLADKDLHDNVEKRKQQMKQAYPDVIHKLTLYLGAGMTIRRSFQKMAEEYAKARKEGKKEIYIYEEIVHTCRELTSGVAEGAAYEHFGKRTGLQEYIRLSTLLSQNLKKGNSALLQRLREEADKAFVERVRYGKRLGEEAVTKLLLPMVLMLLVVMLMIMIPAFSSMGT